jgi:hypothetical protein
MTPRKKMTLSQKNQERAPSIWALEKKALVVKKKVDHSDRHRITLISNSKSSFVNVHV